MLLLAGLGNPGRKYSMNRHNIGFMAADVIARRYSFPDFRKKFHGSVAFGEVAGVKVLILEPTTFMNESGRSLAAAARFYGIEPANIVVLHDELDLEAGKIRLKTGGGHAGHNGLRSIHSHLGPDYRRLRFGIGRPDDRSQVTNYVLNDFSKSDSDWLEPILDAVSAHFDLIVAGNDEEFMNRVAIDTSRPPEQPR